MSPGERTRSRSANERNTSLRKSSDRKRTVLALLLMAAGLLIFLSLASYHRADEANADLSVSDLFGIITGNPEVQERNATSRNWLGLVGATLSEFLIKGTLGFSIFFLPVAIFVIGWMIFRRHSLRALVSPLSAVIIGALLASGIFGMSRSIFGQDTIGMEWSGLAGDYVAALLTQLIGKAGGAIVILTASAVFVVMVTDLDLQLALRRGKHLVNRSMDWISGMWNAARERRQGGAVAATASSPTVRVNFPETRLSEPAVPPPVKTDQAEETRMETFSGDETEPDDDGELRVDIEAPEESREVNLDDERKETFEEEIDYVFPSVELLEVPRGTRGDLDEEELKANADLLRATLAEFDVALESVSVTPGPVVTLYELVPAPGVKISRIVSLENDIALKLAAKGIRIMAPIPGKSAVGVEIPNHNRAIVNIRSVINSAKFRDMHAFLPLAIGKTISGDVFTDDLARMPHVLIAGSTGSGKSVGINTILTSLLYRMHPADLKLVIVDPKKIEMSQYARLSNHFLAVSPDVDEEIITNPRNAVLALKSVEIEMEKRYDRLAAAGVRNIADYNEKVRTGRLKDTDAIRHRKIPFLVILIDELADLMITAAREVEEPIARLAQLARAVGIHLVVATQRPSVDVITGVIKANFPARIAYQVASKIDSRTILDMNGAEQLLGNGDMLYLASGSPKPVRLQNALVTPEEVDAVVGHIARQSGYSQPFLLPSITERKRGAGGAKSGERDELFEEAARLIVRHQQGSVSLLQRRLKVGYSRAARLVDELEAAGIVGPFDGSKARDVLVESEGELEQLLDK